jgi:hypothetical protein
MSNLVYKRVKILNFCFQASLYIAVLGGLDLKPPQILAPHFPAPSPKAMNCPFTLRFRYYIDTHDVKLSTSTKCREWKRCQFTKEARPAFLQVPNVA